MTSFSRPSRCDFELVVFDCDGVLVDSEVIAVRVDQRVLADLGWELGLGQTGLLHRFEGRIFSATEVANGKPAPDLFLHAAARLGTPPERCVVVEDSAYGVQAARAAGMHVLAYAGGVTPAERLAGPGTTVFHDMRQLPELVAAGRPA
ncbi:HAD-IA family hydrolase [Pseudarthrobacter sp. O4]|uniref:HAD-IA family hydrolase n=1 Tax=Pseudarthrobacter sp. O4 TaxID=3418417 RepID=UPI003CF6481F